MANFIKNFKNQNFADNFLPKEVLDEINSKWNGKLEYEYDESGAYILTPKGEEINIEIENFEIVGIKDILKNCEKKTMTFNEILDYSYNAQETIYLKPLEKFKQYINDMKVDTKDLVITKEGNLNFEDGEMVLTPGKMDNSFSLNIGNGENNFDCGFSRVPIKSLTKRKYKSDDNSKIRIEYITEDGHIKFNMNLNSNNIKTAKDYLDALTFTKLIFDNGFYINNKKISEEGIKDVSYNYRCTLIELWQKIVDLEKVLNIQFPVDNDNLSEEEFTNIYLLHKSLVEKKPAKINRKVNNFSLSLSDHPNEEVEKSIGHKYILEMEERKKIIILTKEIELYEFNSYFNMYIKDVEIKREDDKYLFIIEEKQGEEMFKSSMFFISIEDAQAFQDLDNHSDIMFNAEELSIYD